MESFVISVDTGADLGDRFLAQHNIAIVPISYVLDEVEHRGDDKAVSIQEFYARMRAGSMPKTMQVNRRDAQAAWEPYLQAGKDVLYLALSSGISGTYQSTCLAAQELQEKYPERTIAVVDSLCASLGEGLLTYYAVQQRSQGKTAAETAQWLEENRGHICHMFTVDDLGHLYRGGRVSRTSAVVGTMLGIKPVLHVDEEGKLIPVSKVRGRRQSLLALVDLMEQKVGGFENEIVFISHGDCEEDALFVRDEVRRRFGIENFYIQPIGPSIGAHSGPGTVALFFLGAQR